MTQGHSAVTTRAAPHAPGECQAVSSILSRIGDKWTVLTVVMLADGPLRFNDLRRRVGGVSQRMLTLTVRGLERDGLVSRTIFPTTPPRVEYELTMLGHSLRAPISALSDWAFGHLDVVARARAAFDQAAEAGKPVPVGSAWPRPAQSGPVVPFRPRG